MDDSSFLLIFALTLITILGYLAQRIGLCMVRGVERLMIGKPGFLIGILLSGSFAWLAFLILGQHSTSPHFNAYLPSLYSLFGGLLFGFGAAINDGCGVSTISRLVQGQSIMVFTIIGWLIGWILFVDFIYQIQLQMPQHLIEIQYQNYILFVISAFVLLAMIKFAPTQRRVWKNLLTVGFIASLIFIYEPKWTPSSLLKDISLSLWQQDAMNWPSLERFLLMLGLMFGMFIAAIRLKIFKPRTFAIRNYFVHLIAGILMGIGAVFAGGGNDFQLLIAMPSLSPAGLTAVMSMIAGIYLGKLMLAKLAATKESVSIANE